MKSEPCSLCLKLSEKSSPDFLGRLGKVVFYKGPFAQKWPGHIMLVYEPHVEEMTELSMGEAALFFEQILRMEKYLKSLSGVRRINLAKFGNVCSHLHWHIIPRYSSEAFPEKSPWELLDHPMVHSQQLPRDPYASLKDAFQL